MSICLFLASEKPFPERDRIFDDDFSVYPAQLWEVYTKKKYLANVEWDMYTAGCGKGLIAYMKAYLERTELDELELWHVWLTYSERVRFRRRIVHIADLSSKDVEELWNMPVEEADPPAHPSEGEILTHYCLVITNRKEFRGQGESAYTPTDVWKA